MGRKVKPSDTLGIVEEIVEGSAVFVPFLSFSDIQTMDLHSFPIDYDDEKYRRELQSRLKDRLSFVVSRATEKGGLDRLPPEAEAAIREAVDEIGAV